jgi:hypothetical protein
VSQIPHPRVVAEIEMGCGCAARWMLAIQPEDLMNPLIVADALRVALEDGDLRDEIGNCEAGHERRGQEDLTIRARIER